MIKFLSNTRLFFIGLIKILFVSRFKNLHRQITQKKTSAIILGNGPSLAGLIENSEFIKRIENMDAVAVNAFCEHPVFEKMQPKYYMLAAPDFWEDDVKEMYITFRNNIFQNLAKKVNWEMYLFIPWPAKKKKFWQDILAENKNIHIIYFNIIPFEGSNGFKNFCFNKRLGLPRLHNVIGPSVMNMIWLNYQKIYLVGVEHSWLQQIHVDENNIAYVGQPHFYDKDAKPERMNGVGGVGYRALHEIIHKFYLAFKGYFEVQQYAQSKGVKIINLTEGSYIDAFPREKMDIFIKNSND
ncbi:MAG: hypothetical protein IPH66_06235 [Crocinitomicaceae bacterium]|nr:hypothetical protein [Crocinitomicaceae bacterium]